MPRSRNYIIHIAPHGHGAQDHVLGGGDIIQRAVLEPPAMWSHRNASTKTDAEGFTRGREDEYVPPLPAESPYRRIKRGLHS